MPTLLHYNRSINSRGCTLMMTIRIGWGGWSSDLWKKPEKFIRAVGLYKAIKNQQSKNAQEKKSWVAITAAGEASKKQVLLLVWMCMQRENCILGLCDRCWWWRQKKWIPTEHPDKLLISLSCYRCRCYPTKQQEKLMKSSFHIHSRMHTHEMK